MARLFVAVWPQSAVVHALEHLTRPDVPGLRWTGPEQWHVTLRFMGSVADVGAAEAAFERVRASATIARLGPQTGRFGDRVLHVPVTGLEELTTAVVAATAEIGEPPDPRPLHGHIPLARPRGRAPVDLPRLAGPPPARRRPGQE